METEVEIVRAVAASVEVEVTAGPPTPGRPNGGNDDGMGGWEEHFIKFAKSVAQRQQFRILTDCESALRQMLLSSASRYNDDTRSSAAKRSLTEGSITGLINEMISGAQDGVLLKSDFDRVMNNSFCDRHPDFWPFCPSLW